MRKLLIAAGFSMFALSASAATLNYTFPLDPAQSGGGGRTGSGTATVILDDVTGSITVNATYTGLSGSRTNQHLHGPAGVGVDAGVFFPLSGTGTTSGTISGNGTLTATQIGYITSGNAYLNVHSSTFAGGEIRGQVVPEPASLGLLGLAATAMIRRRRR